MTRPTLETSKHADILRQLDAIEIASKADLATGKTNQFDRAWSVVKLAQRVESVLSKQYRGNIEPSQEDLATLVVIDRLARDLEATHDEREGAIDGGEGAFPSHVTERILTRAIHRWIP